jgi:glucokinase
MHILAGDIGGTNTRLRIVRRGAHGLERVREQRYASGSYPGLAAILRDFLAAAPGPVAAACLAVAGPVRAYPGGERVAVTNLPWEIDGAALAREFGWARARLINDFQAIGYGIEALAASELVTLQAGEAVAHGPRAVIGAGTGLGQGLLVWQGEHYEAIATEGGHAGFGPGDELELELARWLLRTHGHASWELVVSGPGLVRLYQFLRARGAAPESAAVAAALAGGDPAAAIAHAALEGGDALAGQALDLFVRLYGAQAGNLALTLGATGGVYVAGGIAPKILARLQGGAFIEAFRAKGGMAGFVTAVPVRVVMNEQVGLLGAALVASRL